MQAIINVDKCDFVSEIFDFYLCTKMHVGNRAVGNDFYAQTNCRQKWYRQTIL